MCGNEALERQPCSVASIAELLPSIEQEKKAVYLSLSPKINRMEVMPQANEFILARDQQPIASLKFSATAECLKSCESLVFIQTGTQN